MIPTWSLQSLDCFFLLITFLLIWSHSEICEYLHQIEMVSKRGDEMGGDVNTNRYQVMIYSVEHSFVHLPNLS